MYKLFDSTNPKLHRFITKFGESLVDGRSTVVDMPLKASAEEKDWIGNRITFYSDAVGIKLFAINPQEIEHGYFQKVTPNGNRVRVYGIRVKTKNSYHVFHEGEVEYV